MREYIHAIMLDKNGSLAAKAVAAVLGCVSMIYAFIMFKRKILYGMGVFRTHRVGAKVISIGNLTLGGTGKTPFTIMLARLLKNRMKKNPAVLIRGYGVDEQAMLERALQPDSIPVFVGQDRVRSARAAIGSIGADTLILDDGFQHWRIARDLDIVLVDTRNPFGNNRLFPRGILREPVSAMARADAAVLTKTDKGLVDRDGIIKRIKAFKKDIVILEAEHRPTGLWELRTGMRLNLAALKGRGAHLVSSIGDPGYFEETVKGLGAVVRGHKMYPDHHVYSEDDAGDMLKDILQGEWFLTTEKDAVKLDRLSAILRTEVVTAVLRVDMVITKGEEELIAGLNSLYNS